MSTRVRPWSSSDCQRASGQQPSSAPSRTEFVTFSVSKRRTEGSLVGGRILTVLHHLNEGERHLAKRLEVSDEAPDTDCGVFAGAPRELADQFNQQRECRQVALWTDALARELRTDLLPTGAFVSHAHV